MLVVDTNVLVYAADRHSEFNDACRSFLEARMADPSPTYLTWNICYEFLRVVTHSRVFEKPWSIGESLSFVQSLLATDSFRVLEPSERHVAVLSQTVSQFPDIRGNLVHDLHTAVLMREHGISQICTRDTDFQRFPFVTIFDPLRL
jgi:hypothetical protein